MQRFAYQIASLLWFFIGYWILQRGWISIRPFFLHHLPPPGSKNFKKTNKPTIFFQVNLYSLIINGICKKMMPMWLIASTLVQVLSVKAL